ncbi:MAG: TIGR03936 family radical SAM-associated protein [Methylocystaceae bacterium]
MRLRIMYRVGPELKFLGNLDTLRMLARCLRRAQVPFALSEGFNPHIKMSLGTVLPVGIWSEAEWLDLELAEAMPTEEVLERLNQASPRGLSFIRADYIDSSIPTLMSAVDSACYCFKIEDIPPEEDLASKVEALAASEKLEVRSRGKNKDRIKDLAPGLYRMEYLDTQAGEAVILAWVASGSSFNVRSDELMEVLSPLIYPARVVDCYRQGNYIKKEQEFKIPVAETFTQ